MPSCLISLLLGLANMRKCDRCEVAGRLICFLTQASYPKIFSSCMDRRVGPKVDFMRNCAWFDSVPRSWPARGAAPATAEAFVSFDGKLWVAAWSASTSTSCASMRRATTACAVISKFPSKNFLCGDEACGVCALEIHVVVGGTCSAQRTKQTKNPADSKSFCTDVSGAAWCVSDDGTGDTCLTCACRIATEWSDECTGDIR